MRLRTLLSRAAKHHPRLAAATKPILLPLIGRLVSRQVTEIHHSGAHVQRVETTYDYKKECLLTLHAAATSSDVPGIGTRGRGHNVLMLVVSDLRIDPRVEREARALAANGFNVTVVCPHPIPGGTGNLGLDWGAGVDIRLVGFDALPFVGERPGFHAGILFVEAMAIAKQLEPLAVHSHDLNTCYAGLALARLLGLHFVADFHEWTSENVHWDHKSQANLEYPSDWKSELQALEARVIASASAVFTVCDSIADAMARELGGGRRPVVVRNVPPLTALPTREYPPLKTQLGLPEGRFVLLWQGGTGPTRLIEPIIEALQYAPKCTLVIRGPSLDLFGEEYVAIAERIHASDRLILLDPVPSRDVVEAARGADAGIWTLPRLCRNFTYALPNKIFEYLASGLPILVADYPEACKIALDLGTGLTFDPYDPRSIAASINRLIEEPGLAERFRAAAPSALARLNADDEWGKLVELYRSLPAGKS